MVDKRSHVAATRTYRNLPFERLLDKLQRISTAFGKALGMRKGIISRCLRKVFCLSQATLQEIARERRHMFQNSS